MIKARHNFNCRRESGSRYTICLHGENIVRPADRGDKGRERRTVGQDSAAVRKRKSKPRKHMYLVVEGAQGQGDHHEKDETSAVRDV
jgi:hypothetical protein